MRILVETNFVQELVFLQEQYESCEKILTLSEEGRAAIVIPAFSLIEPLDKLHRQKNARQEIQKQLNTEIKQLSRTAGYEARLDEIKELDLLFAKSIEDERKRFEAYRQRIFATSKILPLDLAVLTSSVAYETSLNLSTQDAIVYASVISELQPVSGEQSCFLNRNSKDFDVPEIRGELERLNCTMIPRFDDGLKFVISRISSR